MSGREKSDGEDIVGCGCLAIAVAVVMSLGFFLCVGVFTVFATVGNWLFN